MTRPYRDERRYARCEARLGGGRRLQKTCRVCSPSRHDRAETLRAPDFSQIEPFTRRSIAASSMYRLTALHALRALPAFTQSFRARKHERNVTRAAYCLFWTEPRRTFLDRTEANIFGPNRDERLPQLELRSIARASTWYVLRHTSAPDASNAENSRLPAHARPSPE